jgi:hypothetical protein
MKRLLTLVLLAAACGDSNDPDGPGTGPPTDEQIRDFCDVDCARRVECSGIPDLQACVADCVAEVTAVDWIRADALVTVNACAAELTCEQDSDDCLAACTPTAAHDRFEARCLDELAECGDGPADVMETCTVTHIAGVSDSGFWCLWRPEIMDELTACLPVGIACDAAFTCFEQVMARHGFD